MENELPPTNHGAEHPAADTAQMTAVQPRDTDPASPPLPPLPPRPWKRIAIVAGAALATLCVLVVLGRIALGSFIRSRAQEMGFVLDFDGLSLQTHGVVLHDATVDLAGVHTLHTTANELAVTIDGFTPKHLQADGLSITIAGKPAEVFGALATWSAAHPSTYKTTGGATGVKMGWSFHAGETAALSIEGGTLQATSSGGSLQAPRAVAFSFPVNGFVALWPTDASVLSVGLGGTTLVDSRATAEIHPKSKPLTASFTLRRTALGDTAVLRKVFSKHAFASASANVSFAKDGSMSGTFSGSVDGWVPSHPKALDRVFRGNRTTASANFVAPADKDALTLNDVVINAGNFGMHGGGIVERKGDHAIARADLRGAVPCAELTAAITSAAGVPDVAAAIVNEIARPHVAGNVDVHVHVEGDSRNLGGAKFEPRVSVGCGVR